MSKIKRWMYDHEFTVFVIIVFTIAAIAIATILSMGDNVSSRSWHYQCYSGGVLVIDQEYPLNGLGHPLDPETHERVYFKGMDCVVK